MKEEGNQRLSREQTNAGAAHILHEANEPLCCAYWVLGTALVYLGVHCRNRKWACLHISTSSNSHAGEHKPIIGRTSPNDRHLGKFSPVANSWELGNLGCRHAFRQWCLQYQHAQLVMSAACNSGVQGWLVRDCCLLCLLLPRQTSRNVFEEASLSLSGGDPRPETADPRSPI